MYLLHRTDIPRHNKSVGSTYKRLLQRGFIAQGFARSGPKMFEYHRPFVTRGSVISRCNCVRFDEVMDRYNVAEMENRDFS